jgi:hypothetical protein
MLQQVFECCLGTHPFSTYPFVPDTDFERVAPVLQERLRAVRPFRVRLTSFSYFKHGSSCTMWLKPESEV